MILLQIGRVDKIEENDKSSKINRIKESKKVVENNCGTTKEGVIKNPGTYSRMTIMKLIDSLVKVRMLIVKRDDSNRHIQHLYTNNEHVVLSLINDRGCCLIRYRILCDL